MKIFYRLAMASIIFLVFFGGLLFSSISIVKEDNAIAGSSAYYIDFENGNDYDAGTKESPWKHHPWDPAAMGNAKAHTGISNYYFKKGIVYRGGGLTARESGTVDSPIVLGVDPDWGTGEAEIYGSERITSGWKKCAEGDCPEIPVEQRDKVWYVDTSFDYVYIPMMLYEIRDGRIIKLNIARSPNWSIPIPESPQDYALDDPKTVWWEFSGYGFQSKLTLDSVSGFNAGDQVYKAGYTANWEKGIIKIYEVGADYIKVRSEQAAKEDFFNANQITNGGVTHTINAVSRLPTKYRDNVNLTQSDPNFYKDGIVWYEDYCFWPRAARIQNYDPANHEIEFYCVRDEYINKKFYRYFIEGLPQLLDAENEWCYIRTKDSPHRGRIYLRLEGDRDPNITVIEKAKYHTFLNIEEKNNIIVDGLDIKFFNARDFYADPADYPYSPKFTNDGVRSRAAEYFSPVIRITRNSSNISMVNCGIEYSNAGIAIFPDGKDKLLDNIKINHNRITHMEANAVVTLLGENFGEIRELWDWWPIKPGKPYSVLNSRIKHIQIKNNQLEDVGLRAQSWNPNGAIGLYDIEDSEVAYNTVDYSAVPGIIVDSPSQYWGEKAGWTEGSDKMDYPLQRNLIHHNQVSRACLMTEDMGGIEVWHAGPNYVYSNISGNHTGSRYPYKKQNPASKDYYRIGAFSPGLYIDNGFKNYVFNNIFWGKNNNENDFIYNSVGYFDYNAIQNTVFNNTIYNCAVGIHKGGEHDNRNYYLNNLIINTYERYIRDTVTARSQLDSVGYACNLFNGQTKPVFGMLQLVSLPTKADFINYLIQKKSICVDPGQEATGQQVIDVSNLDFHLLDNSAAIDKAKKVFVPWGLYGVVGEWNFYKYPADINRVLDEHFYWNKEWESLPVVQASPPLRYDLFSYNTNESNFKMGALENWVESAFELDGQTQRLGRNADECGLLNMDKDADGNQKINNFLIEAVLKINSDENQGGIVEKSDGVKGYTLALVNGYLKMTVKFGASYCSRTSAGSINDGKWHHIIAEVDRNNAQGINIYIDGKLSNGVFSAGMDSSSNISNNGNFMVGYCLDNGYLAATFDFLRISRGTLAQAETTIEELYDWEFNGPFLKDFNDQAAYGAARDVGALEFVPKNQAPQVEAGSVQEIAFSDQAHLDATAVDDGLPGLPGKLSFSWEKVSGPGEASFDDQKELNTAVGFSEAGEYVLRLTVCDGDLCASDEVMITVEPALSVEPPQIPVHFAADVVSSTHIDLNWEPAEGSVGVAGYKIYRDGVQQAVVLSPLTHYQDADLVPQTTYHYTISAYDAQGNESLQSKAMIVTTPALGDPITKIVDNGDPLTHIDLTIIGSGFSSGEIETYIVKAGKNIANMFKVNWFADHATLFNVWRIDAVSPESGVDLDEETIYARAQKTPYDILIVLHNDIGQESQAKGYVELYKPSDGYAVLAHELGHLIGRLDDEYFGCPICGAKCDGLSKRTLNIHDKPNNEKWPDLISSAPYEGARFCDKGLWRPSENSIMRDSPIGASFDAVGMKAMDSGAGKILKTIEADSPSLSISGLNNDEIKSGSFTAEAVTSDISGIERVEFYWAKAGETSKSIKIDRTAPYDVTIDTAQYENGQYYLDTLSYDKNWNYSRVTRVFNISNVAPGPQPPPEPQSQSSDLNVPIIVSEALTKDSLLCKATYDCAHANCDRKDMPGLDRTSEPLTVGIPLAEDADVTNVNQLGLSGASVQQFRPLAYWPNGNIKWVLVDTQTSIAANSNATIYLIKGAGNSNGATLASDAGDYISINTGDAQFRVRKKNFNFLDQVIIGGKELVSSGNSGGLSITGYEDTSYTLKKDNSQHTLKKDEIYDSKNDANSEALIEENGPARATIKATGSFKDSAGNRFMDYTVRFYFYKNKSYAKTDVILRHSQEEMHANQWGKYSQKARTFSNAQISIPLNLEGKKSFEFSGRIKDFSGDIDNCAYMFQGFNMSHRDGNIEGDAADDLLSGWFYPPMDRVAGDQKVNFIQKGLEVKNGETILNSLDSTDDWTEDWSEIKDQNNSGLSIAMQYMSAYWPSSIEFDESGKAEIGIFSKYNSKKDIKMGWATHETREIMFDFHTAPVNNTAVVYRIEQPMVGRAPFEHYRTTKAILGQEEMLNSEETADWHQQNPGLPKKYTGAPYANKGVIVWRDYWYSGVKAFDVPFISLFAFLQDGTGGDYMSGLQKTFFNMDSAAIRTDGFDLAKSLIQSNDHYPVINDGAYNSPNNHFDYAHNHWRAMPYYYYLTGNEEIKEAALDYMEEIIRRGIWNVGQGDLRCYSRYYATLALGYEFSQNEALNEMLKKTTDMILDSRAKQSPFVYGINLDRGYIFTTVLDNIYGLNPSFHLTAIYSEDVWQALRVLKTYDKSYPRSEDLEDHLLGVGQFIYHELYIIAPDGTDFGYNGTYYYDKENPWSSNIGKGDSSRAMWLAYIKTGNIDYLESGKKILAYGNAVNAACPFSYQSLMYLDLYRPPVWQYIINLRVVNNGGNSYTLSWQVPKGASAYQIKFSDKPIVDWLGFDQLTRQYQYDPVHYTAFFAAWNIDNEPEPLDEGAQQSFNMDIPAIIASYNSTRALTPANPSYITYDAAKTYYFSMKYLTSDTTATHSPTVTLAANPVGGQAPLTVNFNASALDTDGSIAKYEWDFEGKGIAEKGNASAAHVYNTAGHYNVKITVTDDTGLKATAVVTVTVEPEADVVPPQADAGSDQTVNENGTVAFDGSASTDNKGIVGYLWDFGDGKTGEGVKTTHIYAQAGTYTVTLTVKDAADNEAADTLVIIVKDITAPQIPANLKANAVSSTQIDLSWDASTDNVEVSGYKIRRTKEGEGASTEIDVKGGTAYSNIGLEAGTAYVYTISAYDAQGNESLQSKEMIVTTSGSGGLLSKTNIQTGTGSNKISLIFIPSGYTSAQASDFESEVNNNLARLWANNFFAAYQQRFDVYRVENQYDADGLLKTDAEIENLIDSDTDSGGKGFGDSGTVTCIHIVIDNESGTNFTKDNHLRLKNNADDQYSLAHEIGVHVLGNNKPYDPRSSGPVTKDGYACGSYTYSYLYSNVHDKNSSEKWSDLINTVVPCGSFYLPSNTVTDYNSSYQNFSNVAYKAAQIGLAKRTQDQVNYTALGSDFSGTKQYGQDISPPVVTVDGIKTVDITVNASDAKTGIDRVEFYLSKDGAEYKSIGVDRTAPYTQHVNLNSFHGKSYSVRIYTFDEAWNYTLNQYDNEISTGDVYLGKGCTTAYHIDCDCDGYGVGPGLLGPDADDTDSTVNTWETVKAKYCSPLDTDHECIKKYLTNVKKIDVSSSDIYYYDPTNGNDATAQKNDPEYPWKSESWQVSYNSIARKMKPGDVCIVKPGEHISGISLNKLIGIEGRPFYFFGWPGAKTMFTMSGPMIAAGAVAGGIEYIVVEDLKLYQTSSNRTIEVLPGSSADHTSHLTLRNLDLDGRGSPVSGNLVFVQQNVHDVLFENIVAHDSGAHKGFYLGTKAGVDPSAADSNITIRNCLIYNNSDLGIQHNGVITNLVIENCIIHSNGGDGITFKQGVTHSIVRNNLIFNNANRGMTIGDYSDASYPDTDRPFDQEHNTIINNIFWVGKYVPLSHPSGAGNTWTSQNGAIRLGDDTNEKTYSMGHQTIRNNIFITYGSPSDPALGASIETTRLSFIETSDIRNNIFFRQNGGNAVVHDEIGGKTYSLSDLAQLINNNNVYADPLLKDYSIDYWNNPGKFDFNLTINSPAVDFGLQDQAPLYGIKGNLRDDSPDAGCYEYETARVEPEADVVSPRADAGSDQTVNENGTVAFDGSASTDNKGIVSYLWDFGDGKTGEGVKIGHTYDKVGTYHVVLTVKDAAGHEAADTLIVIVKDITAPQIPMNLKANAASSTQINLSWDASTDNVEVSGYKIRRTEDEGGENKDVNVEGKTVYSDTGLEANTKYTYTVLAYDGAGNESAKSEAVSAVTQPLPNSPPVLGQIADVIVDEGGVVYFSISATDEDPESLTYDGSGLPEGAVLTDNQDGTASFSWTPDFTQAGSYTINFKVNDNHGESDHEAMVITVNDVNRAPVLAEIGNRIAEEGKELIINLTAEDKDVEDVLSYEVIGLPKGAVFADNKDRTTKFSWTPNYNQSGDYEITFNVSDGSFKDSETILISVKNMNRVPEITAEPTATPAEIREDGTSVLSVTAQDADADGLIYTWQAASGSIAGSGASVTYKPADVSERVVDNITVTVDDSHGGIVSKSVSITVNPVVVSKEGHLTAGTGSGNPGDKGVVIPVSLTAVPMGVITAIQFDLHYENSSLEVTDITLGDAGTGVVEKGQDKFIEYSILPIPPVTPGVERYLRVVIYGKQWIIRDGVAANVKFNILPEGSAGKKELKLAGCLASDKDAKGVPLTLANGEIDVLGKPNNPPTAIVQTVGTEEDKAVVITLTGTDSDGDTLTYGIVNQPSKGSLSGTGAKVTYTPVENYNGSDEFSFKVNDKKVDSNIAVVSINVSPVNDAPILNPIPDIILDEGQTVEIKPSATDIDGGSLIYSYGGWMTTDTYTTTYEDAGTRIVKVTVSDGDLSDSRDVNITVNNVNRPPEVSDIPDASLMEDTTDDSIDLDHYVVDQETPDKDINWTFSGNKNVGVEIKAGHRVVLRPVADWNGEETITFTAADKEGATDSDEVKVTVLPVNDAPLFDKIENKKIEADQPFKFKVTAKDVDNDPLTFSAANLPQGASFDKETGEFSWTPAFSQAGTHKGIVFEVSDAKEKASQAIDIIVIKEMNPPTGTIKINSGAQYTNTRSIMLDLSAIDQESDIAKDNGKMQISDDSGNSGWIALEGRKSWQLSQDEGKKIVRVKYMDKAGNISDEYKADIVFDKTAPTGSILINGGYSLTNKAQAVLTIHADDNLSGVAKMRIGSEAGKVQEMNYAGAYNLELSKGDGMKAIYVEFQDKAGNWSSAKGISAGIELDTTAPAKPVVAAVFMDAVTNQERMIITGTKDKDSSVVIDGKEVVSLNNFDHWSAEIKLKEGFNSFKITSKDKAGNESFAETLNMRLKTKIDFKVEKPNKKYLNAADLNANGSDLTVLYGIDDDPSQRLYKKALKEGSNTITLNVEDSLGNKGHYSFEVVLDTVAPKIAVTSHKQGDSLTLSVIHLEGNVMDDTSGVSSVRVNGKPTALSGNKFTSSLNLSKGVNLIVIEAVDRSGNVSTDSLSLNYSEPIPTVEEPAPAVTPSGRETIVPAETVRATSGYVSAQTIILTPVEIKQEHKQEARQETDKSTVNQKVKVKPVNAAENISNQPAIENGGHENNNRGLLVETQLQETSLYDEGSQQVSKVVMVAPKVENKTVSVKQEAIQQEAGPVIELNKQEPVISVEVFIKPVKRFLMWRSYRLELAQENQMVPVSWELGKKQKLPFMLMLDKNKGEIYGIVWGKGSFDLKVNITTQGQETKEAVIKLNVD